MTNRITEKENLANEKIARLNQLTNQTMGLFDVILAADQSEGGTERRRDYNNQISFNIDKMYKMFDEFHSSSSNQSLTGQFTGFDLAVKDESGSSILKTVMRRATTDDIFDDSGNVHFEIISRSLRGHSVVILGHFMN